MSERRRASRGSSPLTRGKPDSSAGPRRGRGLIPAHAAKTTLPQPRAGTPRAHPRSRGENSSSARPGDLVCGSSPLTRGKQPVNNDPIVVIGLIPAHAGKTVARTKRPLAAGAHPRSRGENTASAACCGTTPGSSPLTRGKRQVERRHEGVAGLIPAHAGKTPRFPSSRKATWAHPRSRGENDVVARFLSSRPGSSPLTRGKPRDPCPTSGSRGAHPRSRGENISAGGSSRSSPGSSPLTRGKR